MSELLEVAPSGTIGKQTFATTKPVILDGIILTASASAATLVIKDGNASGTTVLTVKAAAGTSEPIPDIKRHFGKGMHVKVTPAGGGGLAYLLIS